MINIYFYIGAAFVAGWCAHCIYRDLKRWVQPKQSSLLQGQAVVTLADPGDGPSSAEVAGVLRASTLALNILSAWLEEVQIENPRLPEECLTAQQWLQAALNIVEKTGIK